MTSLLEGAEKMFVGAEELHTSTSKEHPQGRIDRQKLTAILEQHQKWLESHGQEGERADLSGADLEGADLPGVNLQAALLRKTNLRRADLLLADLQGASLMQANLEGANLLGTGFQQANLQGATLEGATGLLPGKLAGAHLFGAVLPKPVCDFGGLEFAGRASKITLRLFASMLVLCAFTSAIIAATTDAQLLKNSAFLPLPRVANAVPIVGFYLFLPVLLFAFYLYFHFYLQRLWDGLGELPAIFPDGRPLDKAAPRLLVALARKHFEWLRENRPAFTVVETWIAMLLTYWVIPAALVLFWARYLTRQDFNGTMLHVLLVVAAIAAAKFLPDLAGRTSPGGKLQSQSSKKASSRAKLYGGAAIPIGAGLTLFLLSLGTIYGVPHDRVAETKGANIRRLAATVLWMLGYNPYADLTEMDISARPRVWTGREEEVVSAKGARLNRFSLRYAQAHRAFLVNAHLWESDLEGANLSEADLRGANLRQANLRSAVLDRALLTRANMQEAALQGANLARADLREADLSFASLVDAILVNTRLESANLYRADLHGAWLLRPNLQRADLREANLEDAKVAFADLSWADLSVAKLSGARLRDAQLQHAILMEADLRRADLSGADLQGAILRGTDISGANLEGADLREARGLSADQICSATQRRGALLDETLQRQVDSQCGAAR